MLCYAEPLGAVLYRLYFGPWYCAVDGAGNTLEPHVISLQWSLQTLFFLHKKWHKALKIVCKHFYSHTLIESLNKWIRLVVLCLPTQLMLDWAESIKMVNKSKHWKDSGLGSIYNFETQTNAQTCMELILGVCCAPKSATVLVSKLIKSLLQRYQVSLPTNCFQCC